MFVYQFKAQLIGFRPTMWRRFQLPSNYSLAHLAYLVMDMFEMMGSHLFCLEQMMVDRKKNPLTASKRSMLDNVRRFEVGEEERDRYGFSNRNNEDATKIIVSDCFLEKGDRMVLSYDYGDDWAIKIAFEKQVEEPVNIDDLPRVLAGQGYGIIEDCGGIYGLTSIMQAYRDKEGEDYDMYREWFGVDELDLMAFDVDGKNETLRDAIDYYASIYGAH